MPKIKNEKLAGMEVTLSTEKCKFDDKGITEVNSEKIYNALLKLDNFSAVKEEVKKDEKNENDDKKQVEENEEEVTEVPKEEELEKMTNEQLDNLAKELEVKDYDKKNKNARINSILKHK